MSQPEWTVGEVFEAKFQAGTAIRLIVQTLLGEQAIVIERSILDDPEPLAHAVRTAVALADRDESSTTP